MNHRVSRLQPPLSGLLLVVSAFAAASACEPTEISEKTFPLRAGTCYEFPIGVGDGGIVPQRSFMSDTAKRPECDETASAGGSSSMGGGSSTGGSAGETSAGGSMVAGGAGGSEPSGSGGAAGAGGAVPAGSGGTGASAPAELSADCAQVKAFRSGLSIPAVAAAFSAAADDTAVVLALLRSPLDIGGCQDPVLGGCHGQPDLELPDFTLPNVVDELLDGSRPEAQDACTQGRVWIKRGGTLEQSFLWEKLSKEDPGEPGDLCKDRMPLEKAEATPLTTVELGCVRGWIEQIAMP